jgi:flagellar basal body rod protein FlgC
MNIAIFQIVVFCTSLHVSTRSVTRDTFVFVHRADALGSLAFYVEQRDLWIGRDQHGNLVVYPSARLANVLVDYEQILRRRIEIANENIANADTLSDGRGENHPYRRRYATIGPEGLMQVEEDNNAFPRRYRPGNPLSDTMGYVFSPNVDSLVEMAISSRATTDLAAVVELKHQMRMHLGKRTKKR